MVVAQSSQGGYPPWSSQERSIRIETPGSSQERSIRIERPWSSQERFIRIERPWSSQERSIRIERPWSSQERSIRIESPWSSQVCVTRPSQQTQNICITYVRCWTNGEDVGPTLYKCYTNVLCLLELDDSVFDRGVAHPLPGSAPVLDSLHPTNERHPVLCNSGPALKQHWSNVSCLPYVQRLRRLPNIRPASGQCLMLTRYSVIRMTPAADINHC